MSDDTCPYCHLSYDRVPPLPGPSSGDIGDRRRSSGYGHCSGSELMRDNSPRTKVALGLPSQDTDRRFFSFTSPPKKPYDLYIDSEATLVFFLVT